MRRRLPLLLAVTALSVMTVYGQKPITLEGSAGLSFPTEGDFRDGYDTGMTLGARAGYGVSSAFDATGTLRYNRYSFDDPTNTFDATLSTINLMVGGRYKFPSDTKLGYEAGTEVGISRISIDINNVGDILGGSEFQKTSGTQIAIEGDSSTKFAWGLFGAVTYNIVANTVLFASPSFNLIFTEKSAHHLDLSVGARFQISGS